MKRFFTKNSSGFTYVELVMAVSIIALTMAFAAPKLEQYTKTQRVKNTAREIYTNLQLARMTAIKENTDIWVTVDLLSDARMKLVRNNDDTDKVIPDVDFHGESPDIMLGKGSADCKNANDPNSDNMTTITFQPMGTTFNNQTIQVSYSDEDINKYCVVINSTGGVRYVKGT